MDTELFGNKHIITVRALFIGERIDLRSLESVQRLAVSPILVTAGESGCAALFRYGVIVLFGLEPLEEISFLSQLTPLINEPFATHELEEVKLYADASKEEQMDENGNIRLHELSVDRLQIVADILAKSVVLGRYEAQVAEVFDRIEPVAASLQQHGRGWKRGKELMQHIGATLLIQHKMVGRVEVSEKPEILWDRPKLERLYAYLEDEYELRERHLALERKLELIARTIETQLELLHNSRSLRLEWYVIILIAVEIFLTLYEMFIKRFL